MNTSGQYVIDLDDIKKWAYNVLIFSSPAIVIGLTAYEGAIDSDAAVAVGASAFFGAMVDLIKKFCQDNTKTEYKIIGIGVPDPANPGRK